MKRSLKLKFLINKISMKKLFITAIMNLWDGN